MAAALGAACVLGFAPFGFFPLPVLLLAVAFGSWRQTDSPHQAAWLGFCWGLGFFLAGVSWVYVSLHDVGGMAAPLAAVATLAFCAYLALFPAATAYLFRRLSPRGDPAVWRAAFLLAGLWTLAEWLRGWLLTGFPWLAIGYAQTPPSPLAGYAAVFGVYGISFVSLLLASILAFVRDWRGGLLIIALLAMGYLLRGMDWTQPTGDPVTVSLLQGNIPQSLKWEPERLPLSVQTYVKLAQEHPAELTVLPETAIPLFFDQLPREVLQALTQHGDALIGMAIRQRDGGYVNGVVGVKQDAIPSAPTFGTYAKRHLVPFGEYVPPGFSWFFNWVRIPMSNFSPGPPQQRPLEVAGQQLAPNICYEDLFGDEILSALPEATVLINFSNTAWFGDSLAQPQHLQIARLRALETGRMMLRATNTGITAAIAPDGRVLGQLPAFTAGALRVKAQGFSGQTPYMRWGNKLALLLAFISVSGAVLPAFLEAYRRRQSR